MPGAKGQHVPDFPPRSGMDHDPAAMPRGVALGPGQNALNMRAGEARQQFAGKFSGADDQDLEFW